jgi:hypothetical protein
LEVLRDHIDNFHPDIIICDTFLIVGAWISELNNIPGVRISVVPLSLPGKNIPPFGLGLLPANSVLAHLRNNAFKWLFNEFLFKDLQKYGNEIRVKIGLPSLGKTLFIKGFESADLVLHTSIPAFEYPRDNIPSNFRFIGPVMKQPDNGYIKPEWWPEE